MHMHIYTYIVLLNISPDPMSYRVKTPNSPGHVLGKKILMFKFPVVKSTAKETAEVNQNNHYDSYSMER